MSSTPLIFSLVLLDCRDVLLPLITDQLSGQLDDNSNKPDLEACVQLLSTVLDMLDSKDRVSLNRLSIPNNCTQHPSFEELYLSLRPSDEQNRRSQTNWLAVCNFQESGSTGFISPLRDVYTLPINDSVRVYNKDFSVGSGFFTSSLNIFTGPPLQNNDIYMCDS